MLNPMPKVEPPSATEQVKTVVSNTVKRVSRERDLVIAVIFLVLGFVMGQL